PHNYENVFEEWGKPVAFETLHDSGFEVYSQTIAIRPTDQEDLDACLKEIVPIIQRSVVGFASAPDRANAIIIDAVDQYADFWVYDQALADFSVATQIELGMVGNGPNDTVGDMEADRIQAVIDLMTEAGMDIPQVIPDDIHTNEYIDSSIGF
ncbi:MAG: ABC transporter substrate-binding protein, partial [Acidimicrobiales bacterium]